MGGGAGPGTLYSAQGFGAAGQSGGFFEGISERTSERLDPTYSGLRECVRRVSLGRHVGDVRLLLIRLNTAKAARSSSGQGTNDLSI